MYTEAKKDFPRYTIVGMNILNKTIKLAGYQDIKFYAVSRRERGDQESERTS
jgi:hypothetical protein